MPRTYKTLIPEQGGSIDLPVCAKILSVGFQRERKTSVQPLIDDGRPAQQDFGADGPGDLRLCVMLEDLRTHAFTSVVVTADSGDSLDSIRDLVCAHYRNIGYVVKQVWPFDTPTPALSAGSAAPAPVIIGEPSLVPVLWWEEPDFDEEDGALADVTMPGVEDGVAYEERWPRVDVHIAVVPTGSATDTTFRFVGTLQRPQRQDPTKDATFHIYVKQTPFIRFA